MQEMKKLLILLENHSTIHVADEDCILIYYFVMTLDIERKSMLWLIVRNISYEYSEFAHYKICMLQKLGGNYTKKYKFYLW